MANIYIGDLVLKTITDESDQYPSTILVESGARFRESNHRFILVKQGTPVDARIRGEVGCEYPELSTVNDHEISLDNEVIAVRSIKKVNTKRNH